MVAERASQRAFFGVSALLFTASAAVTIVWCASMSAMGEMPMPGGWAMSMAWMRMPGQTWPGAAASFLGMWVVMMVAMMLPSLVPMLWRYRQAVGRTGETRLGLLDDAGQRRRWTDASRFTASGWHCGCARSGA
jgi:predicted metal-binding membrane protein